MIFRPCGQNLLAVGGFGGHECHICAVRDEEANGQGGIVCVSFRHYRHTGAIFKLKRLAYRYMGFLTEPIANIEMYCFHALRFLKKMN